MAITDKKTGVWGLDQTYNKINQGSIWDYAGLVKFMAWGNNNRGELGQNSEVKYSSPVQVGSDTDWDLSHRGAGESFVLKKTDETLWAIGNNERGQAGQNNDSPGYSSPVQIPGTTWDFVWQYSGSTVKSTKTDGTMWVWGNASWGVLGLNESHPGKTGYSSPTQLPGSWATGDNKHTGYGSVSIGIKSNNTLWAWGYGADGRLGLGNNTPRSSPTQIPGTTWSTVVLGTNLASGGAIKTDGTLWTWGANGYGQLGDNSRTDRNSPVQVGTDTTWDRAAYGSSCLYAFKTDGTLWAWGQNTYGQLGQNSRTEYSSPVQVPGTTWTKYAPYSSGVGIGALKSDNTLWIWGRNDMGELAQNDRTDRSSPTQVAGNWSQVAPTGQGFWAKFDA